MLEGRMDNCCVLFLVCFMGIKLFVVAFTDPAMRGRSNSLCHLVFTVFILLVGGASVSGLRVCSYNVQRFNSAKAANYVVLHTVTRIVSRCDICLLQHVVDPDGKAIKALLTLLNRKFDRYSGF
ncbi:hypothetical protein GOODEAATRI_030832 [Goodea atripinnis]|uniref:Uncharacterized protein n=1 Tax=Goodea atripinnis TaxID=208336 RepID=A0ABV0PIJ5_9TELE